MDSNINTMTIIYYRLQLLSAQIDIHIRSADMMAISAAHFFTVWVHKNTPNVSNSCECVKPGMHNNPTYLHIFLSMIEKSIFSRVVYPKR